MLSHSYDYVAYCRETARQARDLQDLALRGRGKKQITRLINERIVEAVKLAPGDDLVDIGCGDGTLLRMAGAAGVHGARGLLPTEEEVALVRRTGLNVTQGFTDQLPLPDESASVVVCNCVLLVVPREKIPASLCEISRIAKPGARVFIGEIPFAEQKDPTPRFERRRDMLSYLYRKHGVRAWFGMMRRMVWWQMTGKPAVILAGTAVSFFASPEEFIALASTAGLEIVRYASCEHYPTRNDYLLRKSG